MYDFLSKPRLKGHLNRLNACTVVYLCEVKYLYTVRMAFFACVFFLAFISGCEKKDKTYVLRTEMIKVDSLAQIVLIKDSLVKPFIYSNITGLENLPFPEAKQKFISAILPSILVAKHHIATKRNRIIRLQEKEHWDTADSLFFEQTKTYYRAQNPQDLLSKLQPLPNSIVLAQAALETGWGESRFFLQASNLFGIWSYRGNESRIAAGRTRGKKIIYLRAYPDISGSIVDYFDLLARARAYRGLRNAQRTTTDPFVLISHLNFYSEQRSLYTNQLKKIISQNKLTRYDRYVIDPAYFVEESQTSNAAL
jgi:Bax protein